MYFARSAFGVRCVLASLFLLTALTIAGSEKLDQLAELLQAERFEGRIDVFEMNVERTKIIDLG